MMNLLEVPSSGEVIVDGQSLTTMNDAVLRAAKKKISMIFQQFNLLNNMTVLDNVAMPLKLAGISLKARKERALECLKFVGLTEKAKQYPSKLSGGQKQRVAIARALAHQPSVLLCDEPTSALDVNTTREILEVLKQVNETFHTTIVLVTHQLDVVKSICHTVSVMEQGKLVDTFPIPRQVATQPKLSYREQLLGRTEDPSC
ncbi:Methionine import ATP-binding protein MetN [compost metagenome]